MGGVDAALTFICFFVMLGGLWLYMAIVAASVGWDCCGVIVFGLLAFGGVTVYVYLLMSGMMFGPLSLCFSGLGFAGVWHNSCVVPEPVFGGVFVCLVALGGWGQERFFG